MSDQPYIDYPLPSGGTRRVELDEATVAWMETAIQWVPLPVGRDMGWCRETGAYGGSAKHIHRIVARDLEGALRDAAHANHPEEINVTVSFEPNDGEPPRIVYWADGCAPITGDGGMTRPTPVALIAWLDAHKREQIPGGPYAPVVA